MDQTHIIKRPYYLYILDSAPVLDVFRYYGIDVESIGGRLVPSINIEKVSLLCGVKDIWRLKGKVMGEL